MLIMVLITQWKVLKVMTITINYELLDQKLTCILPAFYVLWICTMLLPGMHSQPYEGCTPLNKVWFTMNYWSRIPICMKKQLIGTSIGDRRKLLHMDHACDWNFLHI